MALMVKSKEPATSTATSPTSRTSATNLDYSEVARRLIELGYRIIPIAPGAKRPAIAEWQKAHFTAADVARYPRHGWGILCGVGENPICAIDIDVLDDEFVGEFADWLARNISPSVERVGKVPKLLMVYRAAEAGWSKLATPFYTSPDGAKHRLEVLGRGQQFVAYHVHPDTGNPYRWVDIFGGLEAVPAAALPTITLAQVKDALAEFERMAIARGWRPESSSGATKTKRTAATADGDDADPLMSYAPRLGLSLDEAARLLERIDADDYDPWVRVGMALHHEFDGSPEALALWDRWSSRSPKYKGREDLERHWCSFGDYDREPTTMRSVIHLAARGVVDHLLKIAREGGPSAFWRALEDHSTLEALRRLEPAAYQAFRAELRAVKPKISVVELDRLLRQGDDDERDDGKADSIIDAITERCELWHDADGEAFATITGPHGERQHWPIDSRSFRQWLSRAIYTTTGKAPSSETLRSIATALAGKACFEGEEHRHWRRVAIDETGAYWLDLADERWRAIRLTPDGWSIVERPPVRFLRTPAARPFPEPEGPGDTAPLWGLVNIPDEGDRLLVLAWILEAWRPDTPYALLALSGEQGSAKSSTQKVLRQFVDPNDAPLRGAPKATEDLYVAAQNNHLLSLENLSSISPAMSDALCAILTGAGFAARRLYTDDEEVVVKAHRPVALNGIGHVITRPDLLDRAICLTLPRLKTRRTEAELAQELERQAPRIFAGLLDLFCRALRRLPEVKAEPLALPRMADFAQLGEAIAREIGYPKGRFIAIYEAHRRDLVRQTLDSSPAAMAIVAYVEEGNRFDGPIGAFLDELNQRRPFTLERDDFWPRTPRGLGDLLRRYAPALAQLGIRAEVEPKPRQGGRIFCHIGKFAPDDDSAIAETSDADEEIDFL